MGYYRCQIALMNDSAEPRDLAVNVWHYRTGDTEDSQSTVASAIAAATETFYNTIPQYLSENLAVTGHRTKVYDMTDPPPRFPIYDALWTLNTAGTDALPNEVALCLSFRGQILSGTNRRRNRGRIYIGPLARNVLVDSVGDVRPTTAFRNDIVAGADATVWEPSFAGIGGPIKWCVFSRSDALGLAVGEQGPDEEPAYTAGQLNLGFKPVVSYWVDDAFDTQRRRGARPTTKTFGA